MVFSIFLSPSHDYTTFENNPSTFTFTCSGNGTTLLWTVDGHVLGSSYVLNKGIHSSISSDGLTVSSQLIAPTTKANNNITVICTILDSLFNHQSSNPVTLFLQGTCTLANVIVCSYQFHQWMRALHYYFITSPF